MKSKKYFLLYACCIPVKGAKKSIVCDLQRNNHFEIPMVLYYILTKFKTKTIDDIKVYFDNEQNEAIDEYFDVLNKNEFGFYTNNINNFSKLNLSDFYMANNQLITNAIVDYDSNSRHNIVDIVAQLSKLFCEALEVRYFSTVALETLSSWLVDIQDSALRAVEISIKYDEKTERDALINLHHINSRLKKIIVHSAPFNDVYETDALLIFYTTAVIDSEKCCGVVSPWYFINKTETFIEAHQFNSCLNKKIGIDKEGKIKNCPSMQKSYGNITTQELSEVVELTEFKEVWNITKDQVQICSDCEFRYICQDCRAYTQDPANKLSKPLKCTYDPYEGIWN